ncbi:hypothetical protein [Nocardiopsis tropica]|uniref:DUF4126 domain-containing protein n=1 Tax=Nocardiopsis tropica TaxID=109330 RepID=A0ABU7KSH0_9ACTN|nr:hypothetical protein [Nocardiopsis umidischolae]MEE2052239.1 hypothetical protein [Nocardiopsis umidischolae]
MGTTRTHAADAVMLGLAAGARSTLGTAAPLWPASSWLRRVILAAGVLGEFVADKSPVVPSRLSWPSLLARSASAAAGGSMLARGRSRPVAGSAVLAAAAAPLGALAGSGWRKLWTDGGLPPWVGALVEDGLALALAVVACRGPGGAAGGVGPGPWRTGRPRLLARAGSARTRSG